MKKTILILGLILIGLSLFGCIEGLDNSPEAQNVSEEITNLKTSKNIETQLSTYNSCLESFDNLVEAGKGLPELNPKFIECENLADKLIEDSKTISELISSKKGTLGDPFDIELGVYQEELGGIMLVVSFSKAERIMIITSLESQEKITECNSKELYKTCDACCVENFPDVEIANYFYQCREMCYNKPSGDVIISEYCKNEPSPTSCENWPEETCLIESEYTIQAITNENLDYCCGISDPEKYSECYVESLIGLNKSYSECENIRDKIFDATNSGYLTNTSTKDLCYYLYAIEELSFEESIATTREICDNIENENMQYLGTCYTPN
jgi:hypothetical protein